MQKRVLFISIALVSLIVAQIGSYLVETHLDQNHVVEILPFLNLTHVRNLGGIFGLFQGKGWVFAWGSFFFLSGLGFYVFRDPRLKRFEYICFGLIAGGGASNITDRFIYGSVIDFIDVRGIPYWDYIFNTADVMIHVGIWPLVVASLFAGHEDKGTKEAVSEPIQGEESAETEASENDLATPVSQRRSPVPPKGKKKLNH